MAYDSDFVKVHVHSNCPGKILQLALRLGEVDRIKIENMREQNRELLETMKKNEKENAIVAVSAGEGIDEVFRSLGVAAIIQGGQTMNPSIETIGHAIKKRMHATYLCCPIIPTLSLRHNRRQSFQTAT